MRKSWPNGGGVVCSAKNNNNNNKISYISRPKEVTISLHIKVYRETKYLTVKYIICPSKYKLEFLITSL